MVLITFTINYKTEYGQKVQVVGNIPELGNWNGGIDLVPYENNIWKVTAIVHTLPFEYKFKIVESNTNKVIRWEFLENNTNRMFCLNKQADQIELEITWERPEDTKQTITMARVLKSAIKKSCSKDVL
ncbi:hypothetical protein EIN_253200 [Entamoeba invadens IP1]|uniref:CBM20 domain-containing protein n=1 Tax=Entamoeba invadens IP1 TaxID=370355 RepID=A0A0A1UEP6_ENTIV|nr:hypothetical protein EIN_253200 [Entamoeba invadens IP1]ELP95056.1 hypothetical protein EIN_253200 [Entamoeba invadens IP1]|eukprot:XP_004261827.1 hypothetical protein EIN_253200 [Entamoeba invadens IP1]